MHNPLAPLLKENFIASPFQFLTSQTIPAGGNIRCNGGAWHLNLRTVPAGAWSGPESKRVGLSKPVNTIFIQPITEMKLCLLK